MDLLQMKALIEAVIFASPEPVDLEDMADFLGIDMNTLSMVVKDIRESHERPDSGMRLRNVGEGVTFSTPPDLADDISGYLSANSGISLAASSALPPPADGGAILAESGVNHLVVEIAAIRAFHGAPSFFKALEVNFRAGSPQSRLRSACPLKVHPHTLPGSIFF